MHLIESFASSCTATEDTDYVVYMNILFAIVYFFIFLVSNIYIRCYFQSDNPEAFDDCLKIKSMTVGFVFLFGFTSVIWMSGFKSKIQTQLIHYQINILDGSILIMYFLRRGSSQFPLCGT